jgi:hypothetical protein
VDPLLSGLWLLIWGLFILFRAASLTRFLQARQER